MNLSQEFKALLDAHDDRAKEPSTGPFHFLKENTDIGKFLTKYFGRDYYNKRGNKGTLEFLEQVCSDREGGNPHEN